MTVGRTLKNTTHVSEHDWPDHVMVQGGGDGVVIRRGGGNYRTAFVEAFPAGTFLRGEGETIADADADCWAQYVRLGQCEHGPYEPRHYENGCGFCVKCGMWFTDVCEPSVNHQIDRLACDRVIAEHGQDIPMMPQWRGLVADEKARIRATLAGEPEPEATTIPPTHEEWAEARKPWDPAEMHKLLGAIAAKGDES